MGGYIVKYPQSLTGIILMYDSPLCWIGNVTEINQTFPNIPVPKEYVSIYCDLQANNPLLECFWSEFPSEDLRFIVIWSSVGCAAEQAKSKLLNVWRFLRWKIFVFLLVRINTLHNTVIF